MRLGPWRRGGDDDSLFVTVDELLENVPAEPRWLWDGFITSGSLTLLAGSPKVGKSTLTYALLGALEQGEEFAGRATRKTTAVILSEEPVDTIAEKRRRFGGGSHKVVSRQKARNLSWVQLVESAASHALAAGHGLVVVDTLAELAGLRGDDENDAGAMLAAIDPLRAAAVGGLAVLIVAHQRKSGGRHGEAVRGSSALVAAVNVVAELERQGGSDTKRVIKGTSHYQSTPALLAVELTEHGYVAKGSQEQDEIAQLLAAATALGEASDDDFVNQTGLPKTTVERRRKKMHDLGMLVQAGGRGVKNDPVTWALPA